MLRQTESPFVTNFPCIDDGLALRLRQVVEISGPSDVGKSTMCMQWAHQFCSTFPDGHVVYFDMDLSLQPSYFHKLGSQNSDRISIVRCASTFDFQGALVHCAFKFKVASDTRTYDIVYYCSG